MSSGASKRGSGGDEAAAGRPGRWDYDVTRAGAIRAFAKLRHRRGRSVGPGSDGAGGVAARDPTPRRPAQAALASPTSQSEGRARVPGGWRVFPGLPARGQGTKKVGLSRRVDRVSNASQNCNPEPMPYRLRPSRQPADAGRPARVEPLESRALLTAVVQVPVPAPVDVSRLAGPQAEPSIAVSLKDPRVLFAASNMNGGSLFAAVSSDGG